MDIDRLKREAIENAHFSNSINVDRLLSPTEKAAVEDRQWRLMDARSEESQQIFKESVEAKFKKVYEYDLEREPEPTYLQASEEYVSLMEEIRRKVAKAQVHKMEIEMFGAVISTLPLYAVVKEKNGTPTVVAINGNRYVLDNRHPL